MSKIICDVCGTVYPETADQCPICGCAKPVEAQTVAGDSTQAEGAGAASYTYVKGGRFSKANVRKRNKENKVQGRRQDMEPPEEQNGNSGKGLVIAVLLLLLAIIAVVVYIALRFFGPITLPGANPTGSGQASNTTVSSDPSTDPFEPSTDAVIPCTSLSLTDSVVELNTAGGAWLLNVAAEPSDTTDVITYESSDDSVATVSSEGLVTAVAPGQAIITITCGDASTECRIVCEFETEPSVEPTTEPPTEPSTEPTKPTDAFSLNRSDLTLFKQGETWQLYNGTISKALITWTTDDPSIATIEGGKVVAVGPGKTTVYGEYNGTKVSCIIRCNFTVATDPTETTSTDPTETTSPEPTEAEPPADETYTFMVNNAPTPYGNEATIAIGESFFLTLNDSSGNRVSVTWSSANTAVCSVSGNTVTGAGAGTTKISATYNGVTYSFTVHVTGN